MLHDALTLYLLNPLNSVNLFSNTHECILPFLLEYFPHSAQKEEQVVSLMHAIVVVKWRACFIRCTQRIHSVGCLEVSFMQIFKFFRWYSLSASLNTGALHREEIKGWRSAEPLWRYDADWQPGSCCSSTAGMLMPSIILFPCCFKLEACSVNASRCAVAVSETCTHSDF